MEKDFNTGLRKSIESDRIKLTRRRKQLLRDMGYSEDLESTELETMFGLHISEGSVSNMLNSMRKLSKTPYEMIRKKVADGKVAGADETGVENYATVASVIQTAVKNGQNPFEVLRVIATLAGA